MDNPELMQKAELEILRVVHLAHKEGLNYWQILRLMPDIEKRLLFLADCEYWNKLSS